MSEDGRMLIAFIALLFGLIIVIGFIRSGRKKIDPLRKIQIDELRADAERNRARAKKATLAKDIWILEKLAADAERRASYLEQ